MMINNLLFCMCAMGSIIYLCYVLLCLIFRYRFKPEQRIFMLLTSTAFYLLPFPFLHNFFKSCIYDSKSIQKLFPAITEPKAMIIPEMKTFYTDAQGHFHFPVYSRLVLALAGIWFLCLTVLFIWQIMKFLRIKAQLKNNSQELPEEYLKYAGKLTTKSNKKIAIRTSPLCSSPFLIGFLKPIIFLPANINPEQLPDILKHETYHLRHLHNFIKITGFLVFAIHWYCPLTFCFYKSLEKTLELLCDKNVLKNSSEKEQNDYVNLLLNLPSPSSRESTCLPIYSSFQSLQFHITKERILMIKNSKCPKSILSIFLLIFSLFASSGPIWAYQQPFLDESRTQKTPDSYKEIEIFVPDGAMFPEEYASFNIPEEPTYFDKGNDYFITDDGKIYYFSPSDSDLYATCKHTYKTGYSAKHILP